MRYQADSGTALDQPVKFAKKVGVNPTHEGSAMLYYQDSVNPVYKLQAVTVTSGHEIAEDGAEPSDTPFEWEPAGMILDLGSNRDDVSMHPDGKRFIMISSGDADVETPASFEIHVIQNFFEILKERASAEF